MFFFSERTSSMDIFSFGVFFPILDLGCKTPPQFQSLIRKNPSAQSFCCRWRNFMALYVKDARGKSVLDYVRSEGTGPLQKTWWFFSDLELES